MFLRQLLLDSRLPRPQPVHRLVERIRIDVVEPQRVAQTAQRRDPYWDRRLVVEPAGRGQLGPRVQNPRRNHGHHQRTVVDPRWDRGELLLAMTGIVRRVEVERDPRRRRGV